MVYRLTAYEVNQGGSYLVEHNGGRFLVDGGGGKVQLKRFLLTSQPSITELKVVICTHVHADHRCGIEGLIEDKRISIGQLWVPFAQIPALKIIAENPAIINEFVQAEEQAGIKLTDENLIAEAIDFDRYDVFSRDITPRYGSARRGKKQKDIGRLDELVLRYANTVLKNELLKTAAHQARNRNYKAIRLLIDNANSWATLLAKAIEKKVDVVYWEYTGSTNGAFSPWISLNARPWKGREIVAYGETAREITKVALSLDNRQSLVFHFKPYLNRSQVLFTSDSGLAFLGKSRVSLPRCSIVTVPHHGSCDQANTQAYNRIVPGAPQFWLRSYHSSVGDILNGNFYKLADRYCTVCKVASVNQRLIFECSGTGFTRINGTPCRC